MALSHPTVSNFARNARWDTSLNRSRSRNSIACAARVRSATCAIRRRVKFRFSRRSLSSLPASTDRSPSAITGTFPSRANACGSNAKARSFRQLQTRKSCFTAWRGRVHPFAKRYGSFARHGRVFDAVSDAVGNDCDSRPRGFRPLALGRLGDAWVVASETCAFDLIDAQYVRDVEPGEMIVIDHEGLRSSHPLHAKQHSMCLFEHVYFARPDSLIYGRSINESRHKMGRRLAVEQPAAADLVVPVPDSGVAAAIGYAAESGLSFRFGLVRNHYVGRTFIEPRQSIRSFGVRIKLNPVRDLIKGRRVVLIDDSIVRGTTSKKIVRMVREAGAAEFTCGLVVRRRSARVTTESTRRTNRN